MTVLAEAVLSSYSKREDDGIHHGQLTVTGVSPCAYATYLNYNHLDPREGNDEGTAQLRMSDGHWQEMQCLENLRHAGFKMRYTGANQMTVHVGKCQLTGRTDGLIYVDSREDILSIKAMSLHRFTNFRQEGFRAEPHIKCQEQLYLASDELGDRAGCWIYAKHKDTCRPYDLFEPKDSSYSTPIVEALDEIVLGKAEIKRPKETIELCEHCSHAQFCWKTVIVDMSKVTSSSQPELVKKWIDTKAHLDYYEELMKSLRDGPGGFRDLLGDNKILLADNLKVTKIVSNRQQFNQNKFIELFSAARLVDVMETKQIESMRITEVSE